MIEAIKRFFANFGKKLDAAEDKIEAKAEKAKDATAEKWDDLKDKTSEKKEEVKDKVDEKKDEHKAHHHHTTYEQTSDNGVEVAKTETVEIQPVPMVEPSSQTTLDPTVDSYRVDPPMMETEIKKRKPRSKRTTKK